MLPPNRHQLCDNQIGSTMTGREKTKRKRPDLTISLPEFLIDGTDQVLREFVADLFAAIAGMRSLRRALASSVDLSAAEFSVLLAVWTLQKKGPHGIGAVARHLHVNSTHVTSEVGKLVAKGMLQKRRNPDDTRAVIVEITRRGIKTLSELTPLLRRINDRLFGGNSPADIAILSKFSKHLADETNNSIQMVKAFALRAIRNGPNRRKTATDSQGATLRSKTRNRAIS